MLSNYRDIIKAPVITEKAQLLQVMKKVMYLRLIQKQTKLKSNKQ